MMRNRFIYAIPVCKYSVCKTFVIFDQNFHTYSKLEKGPSFVVFGDKNDHSYSRTALVNHTPLKKKRNRDVSTPTGETPRLEDKRQVCHKL